MSKYISIDEIKKKVRRTHYYLTPKMIDEMIDEISSADVIDIKYGEWQYHLNPEDAFCSICGFWVCTSETSNFDDYDFCPGCGAKMRGKTDG